MCFYLGRTIKKNLAQEKAFLNTFLWFFFQKTSTDTRTLLCVQILHHVGRKVEGIISKENFKMQNFVLNEWFSNIQYLIML